MARTTRSLIVLVIALALTPACMDEGLDGHWPTVDTVRLDAGISPDVIAPGATFADAGPAELQRQDPWAAAIDFEEDGGWDAPEPALAAQDEAPDGDALGFGQIRLERSIPFAP